MNKRRQSHNRALGIVRGKYVTVEVRSTRFMQFRFEVYTNFNATNEIFLVNKKCFLFPIYSFFCLLCLSMMWSMDT